MKIIAYPIDVRSLNTVLMPRGAQLLAVRKRYDVPMLHVLADPDAKLVERQVWTYGVGVKAQELPYVGHYERGGSVFHVFDGGEK